MGQRSSQQKRIIRKDKVLHEESIDAIQNYLSRPTIQGGLLSKPKKKKVNYLKVG